MRSPLESFAGLLDRSVEEIAALADDARAFDLARIAAIADIWDNNTFPLLGAACAARPLRARRARTGLRWMAALGPARRELMTDLDPALDRLLPPHEPPSTDGPEALGYRDFAGRVRPWTRPVTAQAVAELAADYDLAAAHVRSLVVRPAGTGLKVHLTLAAPRRFVPGRGRIAPDGSEEPWPPPPLDLSFVDVTELRFDTQDCAGASIVCPDAGPAIAIGRGGMLRARRAWVYPDDPCWDESTAGRAADAVTTHAPPARVKRVRTSFLTEQEGSAGRALVDLMSQIRLVRVPSEAARVPVRELCHLAAGAGTAVLAAGARRGPARRAAFAELAERWQHLPPDGEPAPVPSGPAAVRYLSYQEPHEHHHADRAGSALLLAAVPGTAPAAPWRLAAEEVAEPARLLVGLAAFDGVQPVRRPPDAVIVGDGDGDGDGDGLVVRRPVGLEPLVG